jgi:FMN-dependent NADH-azoreductase
MADSKDQASKADVQTTDANKLPVPELDTESAAEIVYGTESEKAVQERSAFNNQQQSNQQSNQQS